MVNLAAAVAFAAKVRVVALRETVGPLELKAYAVSATVPWKPRMLVRVIVEVAFVPSWSVKVEGLMLMRKSGPTTKTDTYAVCVSFPLVPVTKMV
jgi:hypothetical protein